MASASASVSRPSRISWHMMSAVPRITTRSSIRFLDCPAVVDGEGCTDRERIGDGSAFAHTQAGCRRQSGEQLQRIVRYAADFDDVVCDRSIEANDLLRVITEDLAGRMVCHQEADRESTDQVHPINPQVIHQNRGVGDQDDGRLCHGTAHSASAVSANCSSVFPSMPISRPRSSTRPREISPA